MSYAFTFSPGKIYEVGGLLGHEVDRQATQTNLRLTTKSASTICKRKEFSPYMKKTAGSESEEGSYGPERGGSPTAD